MWKHVETSKQHAPRERTPREGKPRNCSTLVEKCNRLTPWKVCASICKASIRSTSLQQKVRGRCACENAFPPSTDYPIHWSTIHCIVWKRCLGQTDFAIWWGGLQWEHISRRRRAVGEAGLYCSVGFPLSLSASNTSSSQVSSTRCTTCPWHLLGTSMTSASKTSIYTVYIYIVATRKCMPVDKLCQFARKGTSCNFAQSSENFAVQSLLQSVET